MMLLEPWKLVCDTYLYIYMYISLSLSLSLKGRRAILRMDSALAVAIVVWFPSESVHRIDVLLAFGLPATFDSSS